MVLEVPDAGLLLESPANAGVALPLQAFAITLSDSIIEDIITCVQNGGSLELSLGSAPKLHFDGRDVRIPKTPDPAGYDLFRSTADNPSTATRLPYPAASLFKVPKLQKAKAKAAKTARTISKKEVAIKETQVRPSAVSSNTVPKPPQSKLEDDIANLESSYAKLEADKRGNATLIRGRMLNPKAAKGKTGKNLLEPQAAASPRSLPPSPALSGTGSPSLAPAISSVQERAKQQRFPIIHELAVQPLTWRELKEKWDAAGVDGTEEDFSAAVNKVATLNPENKWELGKMHWKELDVFEYPYDSEESRQKAINNAVRQYDRMRLASSDPLWQKLLPKSERGKGICLSKLQAAIAKGPAVSGPKLKPDASSNSGGDSEKDDASSATKKVKGGEPMSRSSSQASTGKKKLSPSEAQAKRLLSTSKKPGATKPTPKVSPNKTSKGAGVKGGRILSKEFVTDSSSDDEAASSTSISKSSVVAASLGKPAEQSVDKSKLSKTKEGITLKPKAVLPSRSVLKDKEKSDEKAKDTIRTQSAVKSTKPPAKRTRDADDDDSSSSGTPLSKRVKSVAKPLSTVAPPAKSRTSSDTASAIRAAGAAVPPRPKNTSPAKSSPLASSPPTNASDLDQDRASFFGEREPDHGTPSTVSNNTDGNGAASDKKRPTDDYSSPKPKRPRLSADIIEKAAKFKQFYARYEQLHHELAGLENPDPSKVTDLLDMHDRLSRLKREIYAEVER